MLRVWLIYKESGEIKKWKIWWDKKKKKDLKIKYVPTKRKKYNKW